LSVEDFNDMDNTHRIAPSDPQRFRRDVQACTIDDVTLGGP
jgi:hypothetical protein